MKKICGREKKMIYAVMEIIWECMKAPIQFFLGIFFWGILSCFFGFFILLYQNQKQNKKNPKIYRGQKIIINGRKEDD